jgi:hypothetical protein
VGVKRRDKIDREKIAGYLRACIADIYKNDFFKTRGLFDDTIKQFFLGYDAKKNCVVFPYSSRLEYYQTRSVEGKDFRKPSVEEAGAEPLYNAKALNQKGAVFVVESPICAMSIYQCGGQAIALCGTAGINKVLAEVGKKKPSAPLILCLDNDEPGQKAQQDLANRLYELNVKFIPFNIAGERKDPNELLMKDPARLAKNIAAAVAEAKLKFRTDKDPISFAELCRMELPPVRWAFKGLFGEGLHMIASAPKIGKSWMALAMCFAVARGEDYLGYKANQMGSLYYALEDNLSTAKERILLYTQNNPAPENAHLAVDCDKTDAGFFERLKSQLEELQGVGFVVVDTLQNIRGKEIKKNDVYGNDVAELKQIKKFAIQNHLCIVLVHHLRKSKDDGDSFNNILGSTGIWGTVDTGITLTKRKEEDTEVKMQVRGRGVKRREFILTLDENNFHWSFVGTPQEQEERRRKDEYDNNAVVRTVKYILKQYPYGWSGSATDIMKAAFDMDGLPTALSSESIGKTLAKIKMQLYYDGIEYAEKRTGKKRIHMFCKKGMRFKQGGLYDAGAEE